MKQDVRQGWRHRSQAAAVVRRRELRPQERGRESGRAPVGLLESVSALLRVMCSKSGVWTPA